jgi:hypothetical protein
MRWLASTYNSEFPHGAIVQAALGVTPPIGVNKLIALYDTNGKADFSRFVRAFEE